MPRVAPAHAAQDVAAADDDRDLDVELDARLGDLFGDALHDLGVDAEADGAVGERLTRELEHHSAVLALGHQRSCSDVRATLVLADLDAGEPADRGIAAEAFDQLAIVTFWSFTNGCSSEHRRP